MSRTNYTSEEVIEALKRTSLPTLVVEGTDDVQIFRELEAQIQDRIGDINVFPTGGRNTVLTASKHATDYSTPIAFLADSDLWLFTDNRSNYPDVIFTDGYSIENICARSANINQLICSRKDTAAIWEATLNFLIDWFVAETSYYLNNLECKLDRGIEFLQVTSARVQTNTEFDIRITAAPPPPFDIRSLISSDPIRYIRGKQVLLAASEVLLRCESNKFSVKSLHAIGAKLDNPVFLSLIDIICLRLASTH